MIRKIQLKKYIEKKQKSKSDFVWVCRTVFDFSFGKHLHRMGWFVMQICSYDVDMIYGFVVCVCLFVCDGMHCECA